MRNTSIATALAAAVLEGEDPKRFFLRQRHIDSKIRPGPVGEYNLENIGICNAQYFPGRGTSYTDWDSVYVGCGDNPRESIDDALEAAAMDGWEVNGIRTDEWPDTPSASAECEREARAERGGEAADGDDDYDEDDFEMECELYYYTALWVKRKSNTAEALLNQLQTEGSYMDKLAWINRARKKNQAVKDLEKARRELEDIDKPDKKRKKLNLH